MKPANNIEDHIAGSEARETEIRLSMRQHDTEIRTLKENDARLESKVDAIDVRMGRVESGQERIYAAVKSNQETANERRTSMSFNTMVATTVIIGGIAALLAFVYDHGESRAQALEDKWMAARMELVDSKVAAASAMAERAKSQILELNGRIESEIEDLRAEVHDDLMREVSRLSSEADLKIAARPDAYDRIDARNTEDRISKIIELLTARVLALEKAEVAGG